MSLDAAEPPEPKPAAGRGLSSPAASEGCPVARCHGGKQGIVHCGAQRSSVRLERSEVGGEEGDTAVRTALPQQHGGPDLTTAQGHPDAVQTEADSPEDVPAPRPCWIRGCGRGGAAVRCRSSARIEELLHDRDRRHAVSERVVDAQHHPDPDGTRARDDQQLPHRAIPRQRHAHQLPAQAFEPRQPCHGADEPDVVVEVRRRLRPTVSATVPHRDAAKLRHRGDPLDRRRRAAQTCLGRRRDRRNRPRRADPATRKTFTWPAWSSTRFASSTEARRRVATMSPCFRRADGSV